MVIWCGKWSVDAKPVERKKKATDVSNNREPLFPDRDRFTNVTAEGGSA